MDRMTAMPSATGSKVIFRLPSRGRAWISVSSGSLNATAGIMKISSLSRITENSPWCGGRHSVPECGAHRGYLSGRRRYFVLVERGDFAFRFRAGAVPWRGSAGDSFVLKPGIQGTVGRRVFRHYDVPAGLVRRALLWR